MSRNALIAALIAAAWPAFGQVEGNHTAQERANVVFRDLALPLNTHSGIYIDYFETNTSQSATPQDLTKHPVWQMTGVITADAFGNVTSVAGIQAISLQTFEVNAGFFGSYRGSYDNINQTVISRGASTDASLSRMAILNTAQRLFNRNRPSVNYVVVAGENMLTPDSGFTVPKIKQRYMFLLSGASPGSSIGIGDIDTMRSDAFVEYCYAVNGFPILGIDVSKPAGLTLLQAQAISGNLTPKNQRAALVEAIIEAPTMIVMDQTGKTIAAGAASNTQAVQAEIEDFLSGPGWIEISKDGTFLGANSGITNGVYFDDTSRIFTQSDLAALGGLTDGNYTIRALDQAGNEIKQSFPIGSPLFLVGAQLRAVSQKVVRGGLKFSESLTYRQAGRRFELI